MKICVAQTRPIKGDIAGNILHHKNLIDLAVSNGAEIIIFPELSITGYEPELARELATTADDRRFDDFQVISDSHQITIGIGVPIRNEAGISISMVLFQPQQARQLYSKTYLHADEEPFFISGKSTIELLPQANIALAICYELSIPDHSEDAFKNGAEMYIASVAKTASGVKKASQSLADIARRYAMTVLLSNCVGPCDTFESGGKTAIWNSKGVLLRQLNDTDEGILLLDTDTQEITEKVR